MSLEYESSNFLLFSHLILPITHPEKISYIQEEKVTQNIANLFVSVSFLFALFIYFFLFIFPISCKNSPLTEKATALVLFFACPDSHLFFLSFFNFFFLFHQISDQSALGCHVFQMAQSGIFFSLYLILILYYQKKKINNIGSYLGLFFC